MASSLLRNPTSIGDIFFSGSQSVKKGDEVTWILDETWAFKATEDCGVSTNASPFVNLKAGQTFLIYKRKQSDIDAGNSKGIYIFDRDTVVALAYPQEVTQDIIIENDIYNDNLSTIIVEAEKNPTSAMSWSPGNPYQGETITVKSESYAVAPATIASYKWVKNGTQVSTASSFSYTAGTNSSDSIQLTVTDNGGRKNITQKSIPIKAVPTYPDLVKNVTYKTQYGLTDANWREIYSAPVTIAGNGTVGLSVSVNVWTFRPDNNKTVYARILVNGVQKAITSKTISAKYNGNTVITAIASYNGSLSLSDTVKVQVKDTTGAPDTDNSTVGGGTSQPSDQLQLKVTNRTS